MKDLVNIRKAIWEEIDSNNDYIYELEQRALDTDDIDEKLDLNIKIERVRGTRAGLEWAVKQMRS